MSSKTASTRPSNDRASLYDEITGKMARYEKARRGELVVSGPMGFVKAGCAA